MPTYMYKCRDCDHRFEEVQGFHDDPLQICPDCGGTVQRMIGNVGVTFKGSGFYRNDARSAAKAAKKTPAKGGSTKADTTSSSSSGAGKDTPAAKPSGSTKTPGGSSTTA